MSTSKHQILEPCNHQNIIPGLDVVIVLTANSISSFIVFCMKTRWFLVFTNGERRKVQNRLKRFYQIQLCMECVHYSNYSIPFLAAIITSQMRHFRGERQQYCSACCQYKWDEEKCDYFEEGIE